MGAEVEIDLLDAGTRRSIPGEAVVQEHIDVVGPVHEAAGRLEGWTNPLHLEMEPEGLAGSIPQHRVPQSSGPSATGIPRPRAGDLQL